MKCTFFERIEGISYRVDKEKVALSREIEDMHSAMDHEGKAKADAEKLCKQLELQVLQSSISWKRQHHFTRGHLL